MRLGTSISGRLVQRALAGIAAVAAFGGLWGPSAVSATPSTAVAVAPVAVSSGSSFGCLLTSVGGVRCWGQNVFGQVGNGTTVSPQPTPVDVVGLTSGVTSVVTGGFHACAVTSAGGLKCWGVNSSGQLGDGTTTSRMTPVNVVSHASGVRSVSLGTNHTCAVTTTGAVTCWGANLSGQLGHPGGLFSTSPVAVGGLSSGVAAVAAGGFHTCALTRAGALRCWGANFFGEIGDGTTTVRPTPVAVSALGKTVASVAAGGSSTCVVTKAGKVRCWGANASGQLGLGDQASRRTPTTLAGLPAGVTSVSVGRSATTCAVAAGHAWCWGDNRSGQVGDSTTAERHVPVQVVGLPGAAAQVSPGTFQTCALAGAGHAYCWGDNGSGQLGIGVTSGARHAPTEVTGFGAAVVPVG